MTESIKDNFENRGILDQCTHPVLWEKLQKESLSFYAGFDPTSASLQLGNFAIIQTMRRLQLAGHRPFVLIGGATGMIGDPSGKSAERNLLSEEQLLSHVASQKKQLMNYLDFDSGKAQATLVNNLDWTKDLTFLNFLRDVGKRFRLSEMLAKDSVKSRLESESGISFTEFSYQILQAYDFSHLFHHHGVSLQIGGRDQWGNITAGVDLIRKLYGKEAYGLVFPLVTNSQGEKFGKTDSGALYLDPEMTSPYRLYQFLLNVDDRDVVSFLKIFTLFDLDHILEIEREWQKNPEKREAQTALAKELTQTIHGDLGLQIALKATDIFFGKEIDQLKDQELFSIFQGVPAFEITQSELKGKFTLLDLLEKSPLFKSRGEAKRALSQGGIYLNNKKAEGMEQVITKSDLISESCFFLRKGKKNYCLVRVIN